MGGTGLMGLMAHLPGTPIDFHLRRTQLAAREKPRGFEGNVNGVTGSTSTQLAFWPCRKREHRKAEKHLGLFRLNIENTWPPDDDDDACMCFQHPRPNTKLEQAILNQCYTSDCSHRPLLRL